MPSSAESVDKAQRGTNLMKLKVIGLLCALPSSRASVSTCSGPLPFGVTGLALSAQSPALPLLLLTAGSVFKLGVQSHQKGGSEWSPSTQPQSSHVHWARNRKPTGYCCQAIASQHQHTWLHSSSENGRSSLRQKGLEGS